MEQWLCCQVTGDILKKGNVKLKFYLYKHHTKSAQAQRVEQPLRLLKTMLLNSAALKEQSNPQRTDTRLTWKLKARRNASLKLGSRVPQQQPTSGQIWWTNKVQKIHLLSISTFISLYDALSVQSLQCIQFQPEYAVKL